MAIKALRGMKDILPPLSKKYLYFLEKASKIAQNFGFNYIETPILKEALEKAAILLEKRCISLSIKAKMMYA